MHTLWDTQHTQTVSHHTKMKESDFEIIVASDVNERDGIGVEISYQGKFVMEIFRDDTDNTRMITVEDQQVPLELMEKCIEIFKKNIDWDFIDYEEK